MVASSSGSSTGMPEAALPPPVAAASFLLGLALNFDMRPMTSVVPVGARGLGFAAGSASLT